MGRQERRNDDMDSLILALSATWDWHCNLTTVLQPAQGKTTVEFAAYRWLLVIEGGQKQHGLPTLDLASWGEAFRTARARIAGPLSP